LPSTHFRSGNDLESQIVVFINRTIISVSTSSAKGIDVREHPGRSLNEVEKSLARSILLVFLRTAAADGDLTKEELGTFISMLKQPQPDAGPLFVRVKQVLLENKQSFLGELDHFKVDFVGNMMAIRELLEREFPDESDNFKLSLYRLAKLVAESSIDLFGFGPKINKSEKSALHTIATVLGVPPL
jgi:hypothetical protein